MNSGPVRADYDESDVSIVVQCRECDTWRAVVLSREQARDAFNEHAVLEHPDRRQSWCWDCGVVPTSDPRHRCIECRGKASSARLCTVCGSAVSNTNVSGIHRACRTADTPKHVRKARTRKPRPKPAGTVIWSAPEGTPPPVSVMPLGFGRLCR